MANANGNRAATAIALLLAGMLGTGPANADKGGNRPATVPPPPPTLPPVAAHLTPPAKHVHPHAAPPATAPAPAVVSPVQAPVAALTVPPSAAAAAPAVPSQVVLAARQAAPRPARHRATPTRRVAAPAPPVARAVVARPAAGRTSHPGAGRSARVPRPEVVAGAGPLADVTRIINVIPRALWIALAALVFLTALLAIGLALAAMRLRREAARADRLAGLALTDPLTGLLNRRGMEHRLTAEIERAKRYDYPVAVIYADLRGLKAVNDARGHDAGDELLKQTAAVLSQQIREGDECARIGGDEFAAMLIYQGRSGADSYAHRVREQSDLTMGIASFPADGESVDDLLRVADRRLYAERGITVG